MQILGNAQKFIKAKKGLSTDKPVFFVFHGGSGSSREEIREAIRCVQATGGGGEVVGGASLQTDGKRVSCMCARA